MAGRQGFSGLKPPSDGNPPRPRQRARLVRMAPPANDNRSKGIDLGVLRFTGLRLALAVAAIGALGAMAFAAGLF